MPSLKALAKELEEDELGRGYAGMTDEQARDDLIQIYRDSPEIGIQVFNYLAEEENSSGEGQDIEENSILGRLLKVAQSEVGEDVFGRGDQQGRELLTMSQQIAAKAFAQIVTIQGGSSVNYNSVGLQNMLTWLVGGQNGCHVMKPSDADYVIKLSQAVISRANEIGWPNTMSIQDVTNARARGASARRGR